MLPLVYKRNNESSASTHSTSHLVGNFVTTSWKILRNNLYLQSNVILSSYAHALKYRMSKVYNKFPFRRETHTCHQTSLSACHFVSSLFMADWFSYVKQRPSSQHNESPHQYTTNQAVFIGSHMYSLNKPNSKRTSCFGYQDLKNILEVEYTMSQMQQHSTLQSKQIIALMDKYHSSATVYTSSKGECLFESQFCQNKMFALVLV